MTPAIPTPCEYDTWIDTQGTRWYIQKVNLEAGELYAENYSLGQFIPPGEEHAAINVFQAWRDGQLSLHYRPPIDSVPMERRRSEDLLNHARDSYASGKTTQGDEAAAHWLLKTRSVITEPLTGHIYAYDATRGHYRRAGEALLRSDLAKGFQQQMTRTRVSEVLAKVAALSYREPEVLAATTPPNLIPLQNGVYDLSGRTLLPHSPKYFFTYVHPVLYVSDAACPAITKFLGEIVEPPMHEVLLDIAALCLYRERLTRHFFVCVGGGSNGKSKYLTLLRTFIGKERCVSVTPHSLSQRQFTPVLLHDKHADLGADIPGGLIRDASIIKTVTGGDSLTVERKGRDHFDTTPYCELIYSCNDPPRFTEDTDALWDRLVVLKFPYAFVPREQVIGAHHRVQDPEIEQKILRAEELSGFLKLALERLPRLIETHALSIPFTPERTRADYAAVTNSPLVFLETECQDAPYIPADRGQQAEGWVSRAELYRAYQAFCIARRLKVETSNTFGRRIRDAPGWNVEEGRESMGNGERVLSYQGIKWPRLDGGGTVFPYSDYNSAKTYLQYIEKTVPGTASNSQQPLEITSSADILALLRTTPAAIREEDIISRCSAPNAEAFVHTILEALAKRGDIFSARPGTWQVHA